MLAPWLSKCQEGQNPTRSWPRRSGSFAKPKLSSTTASTSCRRPRWTRKNVVLFTSDLMTFSFPDDFGAPEPSGTFYSCRCRQVVRGSGTDSWHAEMIKANFLRSKEALNNFKPKPWQRVVRRQPGDQTQSHSLRHSNFFSLLENSVCLMLVLVC